MKLKFAIAALFCAQLVWGQRPCTVRNVDGTYAFLANGSVLVPGAPISGPFMRIGSFTADGKGGATVSTLALYNGIDFGAEHFSGTYTVTSDCAVDFHLAVPAPINIGVEFKGQVADDGNDITFMLFNTDNPQAVPPLTTVVGFGKTREVRSCSSPELLDGAWRIELNGFFNLPGPGTPYRTVGQVTFDGKGGLLASFVTSNNGAVTQATSAGKYTVSADCTFDLSYTIGTTPFGVRGSLIDNDNAFAGLNMPGQTVPNVGLVTGAVATGSMVRQQGAPFGHGFGRF